MSIELFLADYLRFAGTGFSLAGTSILAWRVTGLLRALGKAAVMHDNNINQIVGVVRDPMAVSVIAVNSTKWIDDAQRQWALWIGFALSLLGGALQFAATIF